MLRISHRVSAKKMNEALRLLSLVAIGCVLLTTGCRRGSKLPAFEPALAEAKQVELSSIDPSHGNPDGRSVFDVYSVSLGSITLTAPDDVQTVRSAIVESLRKSDGSMARCFNPRHKLTVKSEDRTWDALICFECSQLRLRSSTGTEKTVPISEDGAVALNHLLDANKIPRVKPK